MKTLIALMLCSSLALAQSADAPLAEGRPSVVVRAGDVSPFDGVCMDDERAVSQGKRIAKCEGTLAEAKQQLLVPIPLAIAIILGAVALGAAAGVGVTCATGHCR